MPGATVRKYNRRLIGATIVALAALAIAVPVRAGDGLTLSPALNAKLDAYIGAIASTIEAVRAAKRSRR